MFPFLSVVITIALCFILIQDVYSANILLVAVTPSHSHQKYFQAVWKELSLRGHQVHVITPDPLKDPSLTNLIEYDVSSLYDIVKNDSNQNKYPLEKTNFLTVFVNEIYSTKLHFRLSEETFHHNEVKKLLSKNVQFDVVVIDWLFPEMAGFGANYKCPIVGMTSVGTHLLDFESVGNPYYPVISPDNNLPVTRSMAFTERVLSGLYSVYVKFLHHAIVLPKEDTLVKKYLGDNLPYLGDIEKNITVLLLNRNPVFYPVMPLLPAVVELGTIKLDRIRPKLEVDLQEFLDKSKQGVIYFSLGSNMLSIYLKDKTREIFFQVFEQLPYNVIFKWENNSLPNKPKNVFIAKWLPQLTVLEHPNTKLFITQGGLQSSEEAILAEVPIIGFPMHSDQVSNVDSFVAHGVGIALDLDYVTAENFKASILEIMTKPSYKENARKLAKLMYDQPIDALDRAVWWIEYVIRHKGARHLRSHILDIPWWQYFMLDVIGFLLAVICTLFLIVYLLSKGLFKLTRKVIRLVFLRGKSDEKKKRE